MLTTYSQSVDWFSIIANVEYVAVKSIHCRLASTNVAMSDKVCVPNTEVYKIILDGLRNAFMAPTVHLYHRVTMQSLIAACSDCLELDLWESLEDSGHVGEQYKDKWLSVPRITEPETEQLQW